jgi:hypothetical protein
MANRIFFENEKVHVQDILQDLAHYHRNIKKFSYIDSSEFDQQGRLRHNPHQILIARKLKQILSSLEDIQQTRDCVIFAQMEGNNCKKLAKILNDCHSVIQNNMRFLNTIF